MWLPAANHLDHMADPNDTDELKAKDERDFLKLALERFDRDVRADTDNRTKMVEDLQFEAGDQWPKNVRDDREKDGRPCLTIPRTSQFKRQITGDIRLNKPAIKVRPVDDRADKKTAEILNGLIRNIEDQSRASYVYSVGADNSVTCGMGAWRIVTEYTDDDAFEQDIRIKSIPNALSVVWDHNAIEPDKSDASHCFVHYRMSKREVKASYPDAALVDFQITGDDVDSQRATDWYSADDMRVAEYWVKKPYQKKLYKLSDGRVLDEDGMEKPDEQAYIQQAGLTVASEREVTCHKVYQYILSGNEVLDGPTEWAGRYIPIIPCIGEEIWVGENRVVRGILRPLKDAQQLFNYMRSSSAEVIALQPKQPWLITPGMIEGYEQMWNSAGKKNLPYLLFNVDPMAPGLMPQRQIPPQQANGFIAEAGMAADDMNAVTGIYPPALGQKSNETSGKAIIARDQQSDVSTFVFIDNIAYAIATTGKQLIDLIPRIYDTERTVRILGEDGSVETATINKAMQGPDGQMFKYDLTVGKYDVTVETGPSFTTRRQEAAAGMTDFVKAVPMAAPLIGDMLAEAQDWPNADKMKERLQVLLPPELRPPPVGPDGQPLPPQPPPPPPPDPAMIEMQAKLRAQEAQQQFAQAEALAKHQVAKSTAEQNASLKMWEAQQKVELDRWIAEQEVETDRLKIVAQANLRREEAEATFALNAHVTQADKEFERQRGLEDQENERATIERDEAASAELNKMIETNADAMAGVGSGLADIAQALKSLAKPKKIQFDDEGNPTGLA
jgi:hypothetical protein